MFPYHGEVVDRDVEASVSTEDPVNTLLPDPTAVERMSTLEAELNQKADTERPESEDIALSAQSDEVVLAEASINNGKDSSGEFVVAMLAGSKLEEQGVGTEGTSSVLSESIAEEAPPLSHRDEDVTAESWRQRRKHVFVLSEAGKPIYSRYGSEEALSSTMGVMMALVSFVQSGDNMIRSVYSGEAS